MKVAVNIRQRICFYFCTSSCVGLSFFNRCFIVVLCMNRAV